MNFLVKQNCVCSSYNDLFRTHKIPKWPNLSRRPFSHGAAHMHSYWQDLARHFPTFVPVLWPLIYAKISFPLNILRTNGQNFIKFYICIHIDKEGAQWLSGRVLDWGPKGPGFEPHRCRCVVVLEQDTFTLA